MRSLQPKEAFQFPTEKFETQKFKTAPPPPHLYTKELIYTFHEYVRIRSHSDFTWVTKCKHIQDALCSDCDRITQTTIGRGQRWTALNSSMHSWKTVATEGSLGNAIEEPLLVPTVPC